MTADGSGIPCQVNLPNGSEPTSGANATTTSIDFPPPDKLVNLVEQTLNRIPNVGSVTITPNGVSISGEKKDCCKDGEVEVGGEYKASGTSGMTVNITDTRIWGVKFKKSGTAFRYKWKATIGAGLNLSVDTSVNVEGGVIINKCVDKNCVYGKINGEIEFVLGPKAEATLKYKKKDCKKPKRCKKDKCKKDKCDKPKLEDCDQKKKKKRKKCEDNNRRKEDKYNRCKEKAKAKQEKCKEKAQEKYDKCLEKQKKYKECKRWKKEGLEITPFAVKAGANCNAQYKNDQCDGELDGECVLDAIKLRVEATGPFNITLRKEWTVFQP